MYMTSCNSRKKFLKVLCFIALMVRVSLGGLCKSALVAFSLAGVIYDSVIFSRLDISCVGERHTKCVFSVVHCVG